MIDRLAPMTQVVAMPLDGGGSVWVEVAEEPGNLQHVGRGADVVHDASETLQQALARVRPAATAIRDSLRDMAEPPDRVGVDFGIKLTAEAGVVIARAKSEANFTVRLEWNRPGPEPAGFPVPPAPGDDD